MRVGIYARVSTVDQTCENQLIDLRRYVEARGWLVFKGPGNRPEVGLWRCTPRRGRRTPWQACCASRGPGVLSLALPQPVLRRLDADNSDG